ncbi:hypothetical protein HPP92_011580 [Vanilla planifolia]|uniref:Uncharacterized protein n=1 Tax=Vanilla planifolia TaxID=51239 RepID=A0A835R6A7_VANPL|nr:hypothetical protein HPP92_011580 [Vanilla planifolia]
MRQLGRASAELVKLGFSKVENGTLLRGSKATTTRVLRSKSCGITHDMVEGMGVGAVVQHRLVQFRARHVVESKDGFICARLAATGACCAATTAGGGR